MPSNTTMFLDYLFDRGVRYLAAGDKSYTEEGLTIDVMFERFGNNLDRALKDFCEWQLSVSSKAAEAPGGQDAWSEGHEFGFNRAVELLTPSAPAAPSERADEREKFEKWARPQYESWAFDDPTEDGWENATLDSQWRAWQARAGLSSQEEK